MPLHLQAPQGILAASLKHPINCAEQATPVTASEAVTPLDEAGAQGPRTGFACWLEVSSVLGRRRLVRFARHEEWPLPHARRQSAQAAADHARGAGAGAQGALAT
jgi:hypothetical protein